MGTQYPPNYVHLNEQAYYYGQQPPYPPPHPGQKRVPRYHKHDRGSGTKCCLRCICCCCCCLLLVILAFVGAIVFIIAYYKPQKPSYDIKDLAVKGFNIQGKNLETDITVSVEANNPNTKIGLIYEKESSIDVSFTGTKICSGSIPDFEQPTKNITMINISLKGKNELNSGFQDSLLQSQQKGRISLEIEIKVPIKFVVGKVKSKKVDVSLKCTVDVDSLKPDQKIKILNKSCDFKLKF